jgi:hypothetical protein
VPWRRGMWSSISIIRLILEAVSVGAFFGIHTAMRDAKQSQMDELAEWLRQRLQNDLE